MPIKFRAYLVKAPRPIRPIWLFVNGWTGTFLILTIVIITTLFRLSFFKGWYVDHADVLVNIQAKSDISGAFSLHMIGSLTTEFHNVTVTPKASFDYWPWGEREIRFLLFDLKKGGSCRIAINDVRLGDRTLSVDFPIGSGEWHYVYLSAPSSANCTVWVATNLVAVTQLGEVVVGRTSYDAEFTNGIEEGPNRPYRWHLTFRVPDFITLGLLSTLSLVAGAIAYVRRKTSEHFPFGLFSVLASTSFLFAIVGSRFDLLAQDPMDLNHKLVVCFLSPFFHSGFDHLSGNLIVFIPLSLVVECGLTWRSMAPKMGVYYLCVFLGTLSASITYLLGGVSGSGLSIAILWLASLYLCIALRWRSDFFSKEPFILQLLKTMVVGYAVLAGTYVHLAAAVAYSQAEYWIDFYNHSFFGLVVGMLVLWVLVSKIEQRTQQRIS